MAETDAEKDILETAFALIAEKGWRGYSRTELARRAGVPLTRVADEVPTRGALLRALGKRLDRAMLEADLQELEDMAPRERVFELVMRRLEAMTPFKAGIRSLGREAGGAPDLALSALDNVGRAVDWLLDAAGVELSPLRRAAAGPILGLVYARTFNVWLGDDTPDHAATMAELDKRLQQAENVARWTEWMEGRRSSRRSASDAAAPDEAAAEDESPPRRGPEPDPQLAI